MGVVRGLVYTLILYFSQPCVSCVLDLHEEIYDISVGLIVIFDWSTSCDALASTDSLAYLEDYLVNSRYFSNATRVMLDRGFVGWKQAYPDLVRSPQDWEVRIFALRLKLFPPNFSFCSY